MYIQAMPHKRLPVLTEIYINQNIQLNVKIPLTLKLSLFLIYLYLSTSVSYISMHIPISLYKLSGLLWNPLSY